MVLEPCIPRRYPVDEGVGKVLGVGPEGGGVPPQFLFDKLPLGLQVAFHVVPHQGREEREHLQGLLAIDPHIVLEEAQGGVDVALHIEPQQLREAHHHLPKLVHVRKANALEVVQLGLDRGIPVKPKKLRELAHHAPIVGAVDVILLEVLELVLHLVHLYVGQQREHLVHFRELLHSHVHLLLHEAQHGEQPPVRVEQDRGVVEEDHLD
mmetsp:Transcript_41786/g.133325  ORF Transcript_41786/g.133325 Transcript_41786/m.133325 type:complete len:209 (+) Transcript_41786:519-1145(+)